MKLLSLAPNEQFYPDRREALQAKGVVDAPTILPAPKTPDPLATTPSKTPKLPPQAVPAPKAPALVETAPAKAEGNLAVTADLPVDCKVFVPAANLTVTIPCGK